jgi:thiosulfate dehydrogenase
MRRLRAAVAAALLAAPGLVPALVPARAPAEEAPQAPAGWSPPDPDTLPDDPYGRAVRYGRDLIDHTAALIGPDAPDPARRWSGNGLDCQSCHLDSGRQPHALPLAGIWGVFPAYGARDGRVVTLEDRIDSCLERSMNGRALPSRGPEMAAMLAYIQFLATGLPVGAAVPGRGTPPLDWPATAADPVRGAAVYRERCAVCHQPDGQGLHLTAAEAATQRRRHEAPPVWGPQSYNDGAGMARPITAARFIRANMPRGADPHSPLLSVEEAFDVAVFIDSQPRPHKAGTEADYPVRRQKPPDATYPPFLGPFPPAQHLTGPWGPIQAWQDRNLGGATADPASPVAGE